MKYSLMLATAMMLQFFTSYSVMTVAKITVEIESDGIIERFPASLATESLSYTAGGLVFNYPLDTFTVTPNVAITVEAASHANTFTFTAELTANSTSSSTVTVYKISNGGTVAEASSGEVTIHISSRGL